MLQDGKKMPNLEGLCGGLGIFYQWKGRKISRIQTQIIEVCLTFVSVKMCPLGEMWRSVNMTILIQCLGSELFNKLWCLHLVYSSL